MGHPFVRVVRATILAATVAATTAHAATITYTIQVDDGGVGKWGLYADVVGGGGLAAFSITLNNNLLVSKSIQAPKVFYFDSNGYLADMNAGFTLLRSGTVTGSDYVLTAGQDNSQATGPNLPVYGFGITSGSLTNPLPAGYDSYGGSVQPNYAAHLKLASGTYNAALTHSTVANWFHVGAPDSNFGNLYATTGDTANSTVQATLAIAEASNQNHLSISLSSTTVIIPDVTVNVLRTGAGAYVPTVASVDSGFGLNKGTANITGPITEAPIWVMAQITGADANAVIAALPNQTATAAELALMHTQYDSLFPNGSFNALFKFNSPASAGSFSWDMTGWAAQITAIAAVPEPASLGLLALGALGLLARHKRPAKARR